MKPSILALGRLKRQHLNILAFLYKRPCWDYPVKQIAEEIENNTKNVSAALRHMCQLGIVKRAPGIYPYRYTIADDERIPALLAKLDASFCLSALWSPCAQRLECKSEPAGIGLSADSPRAVVNRPNVELLCNDDK